MRWWTKFALHSASLILMVVGFVTTYAATEAFFGAPSAPLVIGIDPFVRLAPSWEVIAFALGIAFLAAAFLVDARRLFAVAVAIQGVGLAVATVGALAVGNWQHPAVFATTLALTFVARPEFRRQSPGLQVASVDTP